MTTFSNQTVTKTNNEINCHKPNRQFDSESQALIDCVPDVLDEGYCRVDLSLQQFGQAHNLLI